MSSDLTERRYTGDITRELSPHTIDEELLSRNIVVLAEKRGLFENRESELKLLKEKLEEKLKSIEAETAEMGKKVAESSLRKEELTGLLEIQRIRREAAVRELGLKGQQLDLVRTCSPHSRSHSKRKAADIKSLKLSLLKAQEDLIGRQNDVLTKANLLKQKQVTLRAFRERFTRVKEDLTKVKTAFSACEQTCKVLSDDSQSKADEVLALVKSAAHIRTLIFSAQQQQLRSAAIQQKRERVQQQRATLAVRKIQISEEESRLNALQASEGEVESRVLGALDKDSQWKSLHFQDLRQIVGAIRRISEKEAQLRHLHPNRLSL